MPRLSCACLTGLVAGFLCWISSGWQSQAVGQDDPQELLRVLPSGQQPDDPRYTLHDVDHPVDFTGRFADKSEWEERATFVRRQVLVAAGLWPMPAKSPLSPSVYGKIDRDDYTIEKVTFRSLPGYLVTGNLYRPRNAKTPSPAVLCPHGHWTNGRLLWNDDATARKQIDDGAEQGMDGARSPLQARCAMLARMGCVVFFYDMIGYADSTQMSHRQGMTDVESVLRLQSQLGLQTWNSIRAVDFVASLPDVDAKRLAVTGASGGATQTLLLAAVEPRISVAFPAVMVGMNMQGGCVCENAPLLRVGTNNVELAALFAPKPLGMSAADDWTKDLETRGLPELKRIYGLYDKQPLVAARHIDFPHNYNQHSREMMYGWMNEHLKLGLTGPIKEKPFQAVPPDQLSVWDAEHPRPTDLPDAAALRQQMTEASDAQLAELAKDMPAYRETLSAALEAICCTRYPESQGVRVGRGSGPVRVNNALLEHGLAERTADGTKVPFVAGFPADWNGTVVILVSPKGKQSMLADGVPAPAVKAIAEAGCAVVAPDLYGIGEFLPAGQTSLPRAKDAYGGKANPPYAAFDLGYNRSLLGERVHDLLTVVAMVRSWHDVKSVRLCGVEATGVVALLAKAIADEAIDRVAADLGNFDFDQVDSAGHPMMLPGALKYGGVGGFIPLCQTGETRLAGVRDAGHLELARQTRSVELYEQRPPAEKIAAWIAE